MVGEWGLNDIKRRVALLESAGGTGIDVSQGNDGLMLVGNELRVDIDSLPTAPEN